ncbi:ATP-binding protein [Streptomyces sp. NPDC005805]|uniref:ATP-binding protein n=1 Tax=Streptomyces sp. NPDC005805 TaxID=3157068 RepID=UPI0033C80689
MRRKPLQLLFTAEPQEVAGLRHVTRLHLEAWGLPDTVQAAQLCVSELSTNVIKHVGVGTPATLALSMSGTRLRIEVHDPDCLSLPTCRASGRDEEGGRGLALVDAVSESWGVLLRESSKIIWCELGTRLDVPGGHVETPAVRRAGALLGLTGV